MEWSWFGETKRNETKREAKRETKYETKRSRVSWGSVWVSVRVSMSVWKWVCVCVCSWKLRECVGVCVWCGLPNPPPAAKRWQPSSSSWAFGLLVRGQWQPACSLTHFNYDGSQRAGFAIWTMAASVLAYPLQLWWQPACWLCHLNNGSQPTSIRMVASVLAHTHCNYDGSQRAGFAVLIFQLPSYSAHYSYILHRRQFAATTHSPVLLFPFPSYSAY